MGKGKGIWLRVALIAALAGAVVIYALADPAQSAFFPKCPFKMLTGLSCPGCGSQRALHSLLRLDIGKAFSYNAVATAALPFVALVVIAEEGRGSFPSLYRALTGKTATITYLTVIFAWWIGRNLMGI